MVVLARGWMSFLDIPRPHLGCTYIQIWVHFIVVIYVSILLKLTVHNRKLDILQAIFPYSNGLAQYAVWSTQRSASHVSLYCKNIPVYKFSCLGQGYRFDHQQNWISPWNWRHHIQGWWENCVCWGHESPSRSGKWFVFLFEIKLHTLLWLGAIHIWYPVFEVIFDLTAYPYPIISDFELPTQNMISDIEKPTPLTPLFIRGSLLDSEMWEDETGI